MLKRLLQLQSVILLGGTIFAWYTVYQDFARFYLVEGTVFKVQDCAVPNPVTTPCFYGAIAFLVAFIWSLFILKKVGDKLICHQSELVWLLVASAIFGWGNYAYSIFNYFQTRAATGTGIGCSGQLVANPWFTPCFYGSVIFLLALLLALTIKRFLKMGMPTGPVCQSCGMPLEKPEDFGTETDGSASKEYCHYCYQKGQFVQPNITIEAMAEICVNAMVQKVGMPQDKARKMVNQYLPRLKRWKA